MRPNNEILSRYRKKIVDNRYYGIITIGGLEKKEKMLHEKIFTKCPKFDFSFNGIYAPYIPVYTTEQFIIELKPKNKIMRIITITKRKRKR
jgi:hypothetical protein